MLGAYSFFGFAGVWLFICACNGIDFLAREKRADKLRCMAQERIASCDDTELNDLLDRQAVIPEHEVRKGVV